MVQIKFQADLIILHAGDVIHIIGSLHNLQPEVLSNFECLYFRNVTCVLGQ